MTTFKCANCKYSAETMTELRFNRRLRINNSTTLYLQATITTANWTWDDGTTVKDVTLSAGETTPTFDFEYDLAVPGSTAKYSIAVTFDYYYDSGHTLLAQSDSHTFELHWYHSSDWAAHVYDHMGFEQVTTSDNLLLTYSATGTTSWETALIEGNWSIKVYDAVFPWARKYINIAGLPASKFLIVTYLTNDGSIVVNNVVQQDFTNSTKKFSYYIPSSTSVTFATTEVSPSSGDYMRIDGLYVFDEIP